MNEAALLSSGHGTHQQYQQPQGQAAARNRLGLRQPFVVAHFFWSPHHDVVVNYVGHAERYDEVKPE